MNTSKKLVAALMTVALPLAACGDDAEDDLDDVDVDVTIDDTATTIGGGTLPTVPTAPAGAATSDMGSTGTSAP